MQEKEYQTDTENVISLTWEENNLIALVLIGEFNSLQEVGEKLRNGKDIKIKNILKKLENKRFKS